MFQSRWTCRYQDTLCQRYKCKEIALSSNRAKFTAGFWTICRTSSKDIKAMACIVWFGRNYDKFFASFFLKTQAVFEGNSKRHIFMLIDSRGRVASPSTFCPQISRSPLVFFSLTEGPICQPWSIAPLMYSSYPIPGISLISPSHLCSRRIPS